MKIESVHPNDAQLVLALDEELELEEQAFVASHLDTCLPCRTRWDQLRKVSQRIVESHYAIQEGMPRAARRPHRSARVAACAAVAAGILLCIARIVIPAHAPVVSREMSGIVELPFSDRALPLSDAVVVRVSLPVEELRLAGLAVEGYRPGTEAQADLLLGIDGLPRAIRLVQ